MDQKDESISRCHALVHRPIAGRNPKTPVLLPRAVLIGQLDPPSLTRPADDPSVLQAVDKELDTLARHPGCDHSPLGLDFPDRTQHGHALAFSGDLASDSRLAAAPQPNGGPNEQARQSSWADGDLSFAGHWHRINGAAAESFRCDDVCDGRRPRRHAARTDCGHEKGRAKSPPSSPVAAATGSSSRRRRRYMQTRPQPGSRTSRPSREARTRHPARHPAASPTGRCRRLRGRPSCGCSRSWCP